MARKAPRSKTPKLLTGGNPQIGKADGDAPVQEYIAAMPEWKSEIGQRIDALIVDSVPKVQKAVRWNTPFYGIEGKGWFMSFSCLTKYIKVAFHNGRSLDPIPPVESKHETVRYFHIFEGDELDEKQFKRWVKQSSKLPGEDLF
ncbi:MAG: DUF1801 domain-containing protein [Verrucomicrobiota bacterium]